MESTLVPWRTFSIFISSTFADMQAERDYLKSIVFPKVEEELEKQRIKLEIVDLRWGVDTASIPQEDEREAGVLKVCLDEIRRCIPFFIGLLGDRYGWVPSEERIERAVIGENIEIKGKTKSVTALEIEFGVLASREQLSRSVFYFREPLPYEQFSDAKKARFSDEFNPELKESEKADRKKALVNLKSTIWENFGKKNQKDKVTTYSVTWDTVNEKVTGLETWGEKVYKDILAECESHAKDTWDKVPENWQEQELALLDAFVEHNTTTFCGRKPLLYELKQHLLSGDPSQWGLVLTGESGSGKSAVFSMIVKEMKLEGCFVLAHSAGLSARAKNIAGLLQIWNQQLAGFLEMKEPLIYETKREDNLSAQIAGEPGKEPATSIEKLQEKFRELLQLASVKKRVVLLIDALDRFEPTARAQHLSWLPSLMPQNVRLLLTAITGHEQKAVKYHKGLSVRSIDIFSTEEAKEMLLVLCKRQHKTLSAKGVNAILEKRRNDDKPATSSPLWLSLAVNMLMALDHDDFEKMSRLEGQGGQQIESYMAMMALGFNPLPGPLFLGLVNKAGSVFGETFTQPVFNCMACSRNGLREKDLEKILPAINIAWDPLQFAGLRRWFKAHLILQGEELQWNLAHSILKNSILEKMSETGRKDLHLSIAKQLLLLPDEDALKISETMYHLMQAGNREMAANYYGSFWWDTQQTEGSSKAMAEEVILDEALNETGNFDWIISLMEFVKVDNTKLRTLLNNFIFSLFDKHLQSDTTVTTRIKLIQAVSRRMEELRHRAPDSADCSRDLSISYERFGDLYLQLGDPPKALDKYQASLAIAEELRRRAPDSAEYARDLSISYERLGDLYLQLGDPPKALDKYQASLAVGEELRHRAPDSAEYARDLSVSFEKLGDLYLQLGDPHKALDKYQASLAIAEELSIRVF
ncbi:MAG: tetratricopeptide repeat protein [Bacteroidetes bacterium]|nr:tetratricopeptide repeat protein [Bacteroidota bacterium]